MSEDTTSIYSYQTDKPKVDTTSIFKIKDEGDKLRVQTDRLNFLFSKLNKDSFDKWYNEFRSYLNLDFSPVDLGDKTYVFSGYEITEIEQKIICYWLYHFTNNNYKKILIRKDDFEHPSTKRELYHYLNGQFGKDDEKVFRVGGHILRMTTEAFIKAVDNYKQWVSMW
jgi:hypothetical protein